MLYEHGTAVFLVPAGRSVPPLEDLAHETQRFWPPSRGGEE